MFCYWYPISVGNSFLYVPIIMIKECSAIIRYKWFDDVPEVQNVSLNTSGWGYISLKLRWTISTNDISVFEYCLIPFHKSHLGSELIFFVIENVESSVKDNYLQGTYISTNVRKKLSRAQCKNIFHKMMEIIPSENQEQKKDGQK
jgi:hypothetical protein